MFYCLADVLEKFRNSSLKIFRLCAACHYLNTPSLSWDAMLDMIKVELELNSNANTYLFFEKGIRAGVSYISKRYSKPSNKFVKSKHEYFRHVYIHIIIDTYNNV